eukprot:1983849-Rhodomonas_salina.1
MSTAWERGVRAGTQQLVLAHVGEQEGVAHVGEGESEGRDDVAGEPAKLVAKRRVLRRLKG